MTGPAAGGLKRHVERLVACLPCQDLEIAVATPTGGATGDVQWFPFELGDRPRPGADLGALRQLRQAAATWRPDLIHAHGVKAALVSLLAFPFARPPVIVTYHNRWLGGPLTVPLRSLAPRARASIAVSEAVRQSLTDFDVRPSKLQVIRNGIDPDAWSPVCRSTVERLFTFLFLGRLTEEKGVPLLLEVARALEGRTDLQITMAGEGPLQAAVAEAAGRAGSVLTFLGRQEDVLSLYQSADAVLMPSLSEGLPMTALEGMACGLPILASSVGGIPELVMDGVTGTLLTERDPAIWVCSLHDLASSPMRAAALGQAGRKRIEEEFSEAVMLQQLIGVYRGALDG